MRLTSGGEKGSTLLGNRLLMEVCCAGRCGMRKTCEKIRGSTFSCRQALTAAGATSHVVEINPINPTEKVMKNVIKLIRICGH